MRTLRLVIAYRARGWRWPFRDTDLLEVWVGDGAETHKFAELSATLVLELVRQHLEAALLVRQVGEAIEKTQLRHVPDAPPRFPALRNRQLRGHRRG